ncbi:MAG TPA: hypothetical protein PKE55_01750 [Kiritimatiellia bacterium]|nr:hypothetical protein [Kiritimatiellia bacterium]
MIRNLRILPSFAFATVVGVQVLFAQGPLVPGAAPAPTMKTLQQVQPAQPIPSPDPFLNLQSPPYILDKPGRYILTQNLHHPTNTLLPVIIINQPGVELDLGGFSIYNADSSLTLAPTAAVRAIEVNVDGFTRPPPVTIRNGMIWGAIAPAITVQGVDLILEDMIIDTVGAVTTDRDLITRRATLFGNWSHAAETVGWTAKDTIIRGGATSTYQAWTDVVCYPAVHFGINAFYANQFTGIHVTDKAEWERVIYAGMNGNDRFGSGSFDLHVGPGSRIRQSVLDHHDIDFAIDSPKVRSLWFDDSLTLERSYLNNFRIASVTNSVHPQSRIVIDRSNAKNLIVDIGPSNLLESARSRIHVAYLRSALWDVEESIIRIGWSVPDIHYQRINRSLAHHEGNNVSPHAHRLIGSASRSQFSADNEQAPFGSFLYTLALGSGATVQDSFVSGYNAISVTNNILFATIARNNVFGGNSGINLSFESPPPQMTVIRDNAVWVTGSGDGTPWTITNNGTNTVMRGNIAFGAPINTNVLGGGFYGTIHEGPGEVTVGGMGNIRTR